MGSKRSWWPSEISLLANTQMCKKKKLLSNLMFCSFLCVCVRVLVCVFLGVHVACKMAVCWQSCLLKHSHILLSHLRVTEENKDGQLIAEWCNGLSPWFAHFSDGSHEHSLITQLRSLRALIIIHRQDYSLAKHYLCWLTGDCSEGQIFSGILIHVLIFQTCWTLGMLNHQGINCNQSNCTDIKSSVPFFIFPSAWPNQCALSHRVTGDRQR